MPLSCSCPDADDAEWWWFHPGDYSVLDTKRARRCKSCGELIPVGSLVTKFKRERIPASDIEERIWGYGDVPMATWYHCECCADLYFSLEELGFCVAPYEKMLELVKEYAEMTKGVLALHRLTKPNGR